jgi:hypothetical protein
MIKKIVDTELKNLGGGCGFSTEYIFLHLILSLVNQKPNISFRYMIVLERTGHIFSFNE